MCVLSVGIHASSASTLLVSGPHKVGLLCLSAHCDKCGAMLTVYLTQNGGQYDFLAKTATIVHYA